MNSDAWFTNFGNIHRLPVVCCSWLWKWRPSLQTAVFLSVLYFCCDKLVTAVRFSVSLIPARAWQVVFMVAVAASPHKGSLHTPYFSIQTAYCILAYLGLLPWTGEVMYVTCNTLYSAIFLWKLYKFLTQGRIKYVPPRVEGTLEECSVCFGRNLDKVTLPCGHAFCNLCVTRWVQHNSTCPICRVALLPELDQMSREVQNIGVFVMPVFHVLRTIHPEWFGLPRQQPIPFAVPVQERGSDTDCEEEELGTHLW